MDTEQRQAMVERHRQSLMHYGYGPETLFWSTRGIQKQRFKVLSEIGIQNGDSLLDVGCGFADLQSWLNGQAIHVNYTGIDLSPDILDTAKTMNPQLKLQCGELFDFNWPQKSFDWLILSGTLNWNLHDDGHYAKRMIQHMFELCSQGVAFNMLNAQYCDHALLGEMVAFDPEHMLDWCRSITPQSQLRTDYLANDFTIYMHRMC
ncbi:class I SAM-dependent methyltransferase [Mariprofundus sp. EBB-1]|uniref:class I SAM-dependent methyltransferase n=1 Tax=Mariprofundus sp. EBB-1 TaxID=2650971 RepID=UPI000EF228E1|nr:class I SAM-dependent methyltransferase [Mariprofundus sp. EBB-1]RLL53678.1 class I SAM-dependent methyltransferase [Mariprofundus sp. EBB-1]